MTLLITVFWFFAFCYTSAAAQKIEFISEPETFTYLFNKSEIDLKWEYKTTPSSLQPSPIFWHAVINGTREAIAFIANGKVVLLKQCLNKCKITKPATLTIGNLTDNDFTTYDIEITTPGIVTQLSSNTTVVKAVPPLINPIANVTTAEGRLNIVLRCNASGIPPPKSYKWKKRGLSDVFSNERIFLVSKNISRSDAGWYQCIATNGFGNPASQQVYIDVHYPPKIKELTTSNSSSFIGQNVIFCCYSDGNPPPTYRWILPNGNLLNQNGRCLDVKLNTRHNFGNYSCVVSNANGDDIQTTKIRQLFSPNKVSRINYDARPFGIFLSWNKTKYDGGAKVMHYIVVIVDKSGGQKFQVTSQTNYDVKHLTRNTKYTICVQAENIVGKSNKTCAVIQTPNKGKPEQPSITDIVPVGITPGVKIIWYAPSPGILHYIVKYSKKDSKQWIERNTTGSLLTFELKDLQSGNYAVQVIAVNEYGESFPSENKTFTISPAVTDYTTGPTATSSDEASSSRNTGVIAGSVVAGTIVVIIAMVLLWRYARRRTQNGSPSKLDTSLTKIKRHPDLGDIGNEENVVFGMERISKKIHELPESDYENLHQKSRIKSNEKDWEVRRENIKIEKIIGKGSFGQVAKGILMIEAEDGEIKKQVVAVKMTKDGCSDSDKKDLLSELNIMKCLPQHANVIQLLGYVTMTEPLLVVISFVPFGDLLGYLRKSRGKVDRYFNDPDIKPKTNLTSKELIRFARDVACGMEFLALNKVVHRDLAARNVLVGEELVCKITDFGMARDVYQDNIYTKTSRGRIPVKWTAYESLMYNKYTTQSDVWSYGILLFEIFTIGGTPYPGVKGRDVYSLLKEGYRIEKPSHVDNELYSVMSHCWETKPEERPSFSSLKKVMKEMERKHEDYVNLREYNSSLYENIEDFE